MALVFRENSTLKNFKEILNYYKKLFEDVLNTSDKSNKQNHGANPFLPDKWEISSNNEDNTVHYVYNQGYNYLKNLIDTVEETKNGIHKGLRTLFINYDDPEDYWQEDLNYNLINGYAEASRSLQYYNKETQEFEERPEYFWTRGNYYDMLPMCTEGKYLLAYKTAVENACLILEEYKTTFYKYKCAYNSGSGESSDMLLTYNIVNASYAIADGGESQQSWNRNSRMGMTVYFYTSFWNKYLSGLKHRIRGNGKKTVGKMLKIGQKTQYPEQTNDSNVVYTKKYYSNSIWESSSTGEISNSKIVNTTKLSSNCGKYESKNIINVELPGEGN